MAQAELERMEGVEIENRVLKAKIQEMESQLNSVSTNVMST